MYKRQEFGYTKDEIYPIRITEQKCRTHVNLLLIVNDEGVKHYCLIRSMSRLLNPLAKSKAPSVYCNYCLKRFRDNTDPEMARKRLEDHETLCMPHGAQKVELPSGKYRNMYFKAYTKYHRVPYTVYALSLIHI